MPEGERERGPRGSISSNKEVALDALRESNSLDNRLLRSVGLLAQLLEFLHEVTVIAMLALRSCLTLDGGVSGTGRPVT